MNKFWNHIDQKYFKIALYCLGTVFAGLFILLLAYESTGFWVRVGKILAAIAQPLTYGLVLTYLLMPLTNFFDRKFSKGSSRGGSGDSQPVSRRGLDPALALAGYFTSRDSSFRDLLQAAEPFQLGQLRKPL